VGPVNIDPLFLVLLGIKDPGLAVGNIFIAGQIGIVYLIHDILLILCSGRQSSQRACVSKAGPFQAGFSLLPACRALLSLS
jgi:hypothetical protein